MGHSREALRFSLYGAVVVLAAYIAVVGLQLLDHHDPGPGALNGVRRTA